MVNSRNHREARRKSTEKNTKKEMNGSVGFTRNIGSRISWFLGGVGFCAGVGGGISCGLSQTIPLFDSQFRKK